MNHPTHIIGDSSTIKERFGSENGAVRAEKLLDVLCFNATNGVLYMQVHEIAAGNPASAPFDGTVPRFSFPVQPGLGGTLGRAVDMSGIYCCWSTTSLAKTLVADNSGSINIVIKG